MEPMITAEDLEIHLDYVHWMEVCSFVYIKQIVSIGFKLNGRSGSSSQFQAYPQGKTVV